MSLIFIQNITVGTKLIQDWKVMDQIDTIKRLETKLKYDVNNSDQILSLFFFILERKVSISF